MGEVFRGLYRERKSKKIFSVGQLSCRILKSKYNILVNNIERSNKSMFSHHHRTWCLPWLVPWPKSIINIFIPTSNMTISCLQTIYQTGVKNKVNICCKFELLVHTTHDIVKGLFKHYLISSYIGVVGSPKIVGGGQIGHQKITNYA